MARRIIPRYQTFSRVKDHVYPLGVSVLVRFSGWKYFRAGKIITKGYSHNLEQIGQTQFWQEVPKPIYWFVQDSNGDKMHLSPSGSGVEVKFLDGKVWKCELTWYKDRITRKADGSIIITPVPKHLPKSPAEALAMEAAI